jgi:hypothetical protein
MNISEAEVKRKGLARFLIGTCVYRVEAAVASSGASWGELLLFTGCRELVFLRNLISRVMCRVSSKRAGRRVRETDRVGAGQYGVG